jgi:hypothetical protein
MANSLAGETLIDYFAHIADKLYVGAILRAGIVDVGMVAPAAGKAGGKAYGKADYGYGCKKTVSTCAPKPWRQVATTGCGTKAWVCCWCCRR